MSKDLKELAKEIAATENPYAEFDKHASNLDDTHTKTLSRELNRQLFLKSLDGSNLNNDISFGIIDSGVGHGAVVGTESGTEKTASLKDNINKSHLITDDMFLLSRDDNKMIKMASYGSFEADQYKDVLSDDFKKIASDQSSSLAKKRNDAKLRLSRDIEEYDYEIINSIIKTASHEGELRGALSILASNGREDMIEAVIMSSNYSIDDIANVDSDELSKTASLYFKELSIVSSEAIDAIENADNSNMTDAIEKVALLGKIISKGMSAAGIVGGAIGGVTKGVASGTAKLTGKAIIGSGMYLGRKALGAGKLAKRNPKKAAALVGGGIIAADTFGKAEENREKIVDGLM